MPEPLRKTTNRKRLEALKRGEKEYVGLLCAECFSAIRYTHNNRCARCHATKKIAEILPAPARVREESVPTSILLFEDEEPD